MIRETLLKVENEIEIMIKKRKIVMIKEEK